MNALILRRASLVAAIGGLLMPAGASMKSASATDLTGLAEFSICDDSSVCALGDFAFNGTAGPGSLWARQSGNRSYNLYVGDVPGVASDSQFFNSGNGSAPAIDFGLAVGSHTYSMFEDNHPLYTPDGLNMFFNGVGGIPGISVFAPVQIGSSEPTRVPDCATGTPALAPGLFRVPGACSLSFFDGANTVTLMDYFWQRSNAAGKVVDLISPVNNMPNSQANFVGQFTVVVTAGDTAQGSITGIPEPASVGILGAGLLVLWHRKRRRRG